MSSGILDETRNCEMGTAFGTTATKITARDRVFAAASDLFYRKGFQGVGVEEIVQQAGVAKISLYRSFASKDDLIVAYLEENGRVFLEGWDAAFDRYRGTPRKQLQAIMTYVAETTEEPGYRGCPYINFSAEFPDISHPGRHVAAAIKQAIRDRFLRLAQALEVAQPQRLADAWLLLFEGAYALSQTLGPAAGTAGRSLLWAAEALVEASE
jgi:AcrR family transcriptional regulator